MSDTLRCPDCGRENPAASDRCAGCNFPLHGIPAAESPAAPESAVSERVAGSEGALGPDDDPAPILPRRPIRARRPRPQSGLQLQLWLMFAVFAAVSVIFIAVKSNYDRETAPIEGSNEEQMKRAGAFQAALVKDSTDIDAHIGLANVLYDTANWPEAIVHYRAAVNRDSSRATVLVDLGVCYYTLGDATHAAELFRLALRRDPHQPIALFNLGIVSERNGDKVEAMRYYHRALESGPPEELKKAVMDAMTRLGRDSGMTAPPLDQNPGSSGSR